LKTYRQLLGGSDRCWDNVVVALTRCDYSADDFESLDEYLKFLEEEERIFQ
jgi:hypothetical protein